MCIDRRTQKTCQEMIGQRHADSQTNMACTCSTNTKPTFDDTLTYLSPSSYGKMLRPDLTNAYMETHPVIQQQSQSISWRSNKSPLSVLPVSAIYLWSGWFLSNRSVWSDSIQNPRKYKQSVAHWETCPLVVAGLPVTASHFHMSLPCHDRATTLLDSRGYFRISQYCVVMSWYFVGGVYDLS